MARHGRAVYHVVHTERVRLRRAGHRTVYDHLDVMASHEGFNDRLMNDCEFSGPAGAKARVRTKALVVADVVGFEVVEVEAPPRIVEVAVAAKAGRTGQGTYVLSPVTPLVDKLLAPVVRPFIGRNDQQSMRRLAGQLISVERKQAR